MDIGHHMSGGICLTRIHRFSIISSWSFCIGELLLKSCTSFICGDDVFVAGDCGLRRSRWNSIFPTLRMDFGEWCSSKEQGTEV